MQNENGVYGIVLASGLSTRMGRPKLLLEWQGVTILEHTLKNIAAVPLDGVKVVIPTHNECLKKTVISYGFDPILNDTPARGLGNSLSLSLQSIPSSCQAVIVLLGDQPTLSSEDIYKMWFTFKQLAMNQKKRPKVILQMKYLDGRVGHPILFSKHFNKRLRSLDGDIGGKNIIQENSRYLLHCYSRNKYPNDIDTHYDYMQLLKGKGGR